MSPRWAICLRAAMAILGIPFLQGCYTSRAYVLSEAELGKIDRPVVLLAVPRSGYDAAVGINLQAEELEIARKDHKTLLVAPASLNEKDLVPVIKDPVNRQVRVLHKDRSFNWGPLIGAGAGFLVGAITFSILDANTQGDHRCCGEPDLSGLEYAFIPMISTPLGALVGWVAGQKRDVDVRVVPVSEIPVMTPHPAAEPLSPPLPAPTPTPASIPVEPAPPSPGP